MCYTMRAMLGNLLHTRNGSAGSPSPARWSARPIAGRIGAAVLLTLAAVIPFQLSGCSKSDRIIDVGSSCARIQVDDEAGGTVDVTGGEDSACPGLCTITNSEFCATSPATPDCSVQSASIDACGVPLNSPPKSSGQTTAELARSANVNEYGGSGPVDLSCFSPDGFPAAAQPSASQNITVKGIAKIFSNGCSSRDVDIAIHKVIRDGSDSDGMPGELVGQAVVTASDCTTNGVFEDIEECTDGRYECTFEYPNVPTETELMVVTKGVLWTPIYEYGLFISNAEVKDGSFEKDVRALAKDDYGVIAQVAMGMNITPGRGALAGEVHDCGDVRIMNAVVDVNREKFITTYFTVNEDNPLPDLTRRGTSTLGLYSAMDIAPGPITVAAAGVVDGKLVGIGHFTGRIFPDAVSSFTFRGLRPFQVK